MMFFKCVTDRWCFIFQYSFIKYLIISVLRSLFPRHPLITSIKYNVVSDKDNIKCLIIYLFCYVILFCSFFIYPEVAADLLEFHNLYTYFAVAFSTGMYTLRRHTLLSCILLHFRKSPNLSRRLRLISMIYYCRVYYK